LDIGLAKLTRAAITTIAMARCWKGGDMGLRWAGKASAVSRVIASVVHELGQSIGGSVETIWHLSRRKLGKVFAVLAIPFWAAPIWAGASSATPVHQRTAQEIRSDAQWAAQHAVSEVKANGIQGLIDDITKCYDTTVMPAFRCIYLDMAGWSIDTSMGKTLGLDGPTKEFFLGQTMDGRLRPQMNIQHLTEAQAKDQITVSVSLMQSEVNAEWVVQALAEHPAANKKPSSGDCTSVADCSK
jgi:hypothetical protein